VLHTFPFFNNGGVAEDLQEFEIFEELQLTILESVLARFELHLSKSPESSSETIDILIILIILGFYCPDPIIPHNGRLSSGLSFRCISGFTNLFTSLLALTEIKLT
jgi:hypothetical protein